MPYARKDTLSWQTGLYYHLYNRGARRLTIFREPTNYLFVMANIKKYRRILEISVIAYCLMPNHYHFLVRQDGDASAGKLPQLVFNSYSKAYNKKYNHSGTLFEGRFRAKQIRTDAHLLHLCRYIHCNPVKDGFVAEPSDWPYSNFLDWIEERSYADAMVDQEFIRDHFSGATDYRAFVDEYLRSRQLPPDVSESLEEVER